MKIEYNKVTWYSTAIAIILYLFVFALAFYLGQRYEAANSVSIEENPITAIFTCSENKAIYAEFINNEVRLKLSDGRFLILPQAISASGARYADQKESFVFWNKGNGAFIEEKGNITFKDCLTKE